MTVKLKIHGQREDAGPSGAVRGGAPVEGLNDSVTAKLGTVEVVESFDLSASARAATGEPIDVSPDDGDLLEIELEGGYLRWTTAGRYADDMKLLVPEACDGNTIAVGTMPEVGDRGAGEWLASKLRILNLKNNIKDTFSDAQNWPTGLDDLTNLASELGINIGKNIPAWLATKALIRYLENTLEPGPGLYTWLDLTRPPETGKPSPVTAADIDADKPILVFIHGTASCTRGSFGGFLDDDAQPQWQTLTELFGDRIYAFEHRTLSDSPIDNAIDLLGALPKNARVNIVSHSRGGLVGDLISLKSINLDLVTRFDRHDEDLEKADLNDQRQLAELAKLIDEKQLRIERFVRCAAPSRGTLLAGENIDRFLSVLANLINLIPGVGGTIFYEVIKRIALEIIRNRTKPALVPGIEAMMPESPLVAWLNNVKEPAAGDIGVIAGDIQGGNWLKRLGIFASDRILYESRDNDLVVNTDAMFNGARRNVAGYIFDQGSDVSHFKYFQNPRTRAAMVDWLAAKPGQRPASFRELPTEQFEPVPMLRAMQARDGADQPVVFVLPGIMGSHLDVGDDEVWLHHRALLTGGFSKLHIDAADVKAVALVGDGYRELCEHLQQSHIVIPFAYDWRKSIANAANLLAIEVERQLAQTTQPVRFIVHSMGGLVVRAMIAARGDLWNKICQREGARLVMLGTPNRGSFDIVETLVGTAPTIRQLALLDLVNSAGDIGNIVAQFPGVLELLPEPDKFLDSGPWEDYQRKRKASVVPEAQQLQNARTVREGIDSHLDHEKMIPHADRVCYVAGTSPRTVTGVEIEHGHVRLSITTEGDGRVTHASGQLPGVTTWYMEAVHGDLASHKPSFPALTELLETGTTTRLSGAPLGATRGLTRDLGGPDPTKSTALPQPVLYPTETSLASGILGQESRRPYQPEARPTFSVKVVHGDLQHARYPIVVGHYEGDTIVGAEAQVDKMLGGALKQRYSLGLYPGELRSVAVILRKPTALQEALQKPSGAVVIGLGKWGELGAGQLADLLRRGALQYVLQRCDSIGPFADDGVNTPKVGLSVLLVGGASGPNITVGDSVGAILRAIAQVNQELTNGTCDAMTIQDLEIIELYKDRAAEAAHAVNSLAPLVGKELDSTIVAAPLLHRGRDGRERLRVSTQRTAWRRWEVSVVATPHKAAAPRLPRPLADRLKRAVLESESADTELLAALAELAIGQPAEPEAHREIRFLTLSERARAEATAQQRQPELVDRLIKDSISRPTFKTEQSRVLFELTVPNELKSSLAQVDKLMLVVDAETAAYPWELMSAGDKPLCIAKHLVRQLKTSNYRPQIGARAGTAAFVVGDPKVSPPFRQLPGAEAEARAVYDMLKAGGFDVDPLVSKPSALNVLAGLYKKPYRIVHLAGHGHYEPPTNSDQKARSGLVLDNGLFLTAVEVGQMQFVPELVFLNCCHIGQTGPEGESPSAAALPSGDVEFNRLAASVSRELIEMGVRAVVAAGWAVSDDAAKAFAETFYRSMLGGDTFGDALKAARDHTYDAFETTNTWGAYQAYGDPDYRLNPAAGNGLQAQESRVDAAEFIEAVHYVSDTIEGDAESKATAVKMLDDLIKNCPPEWLGQTDVQMEIGNAYGQLAEFEKARKYLALSLAAGPESTTTLHAVEQLANFEGRFARKVEDTQRAEVLRQKAISRLQSLLAVAETAERHALLGAEYMRGATAAAYQEGASARSQRETAKRRLRKSADSYKNAHDWNRQRGILDPYPTLNWLTVEMLLHNDVPEAEELLQRCEQAARENFATDRKFFTAIAIPDASLVHTLMEGELSTNNSAAKKQLDRLRDKYREVVKLATPTAKELDSASQQIIVIADMLEKLEPKGRKTETKATVDNLRQLHRMILAIRTSDAVP